MFSTEVSTRKFDSFISALEFKLFFVYLHSLLLLSSSSYIRRVWGDKMNDVKVVYSVMGLRPTI
jgi:hypothetical protein